MTAIPLEQVGLITTGPEAGQYVLVRDDRAQTGGFLIFQSSAPDVFSGSEVFDSWVQRRGDVDTFFSEAGWNMHWLQQLAPL